MDIPPNSHECVYNTALTDDFFWRAGFDTTEEPFVSISDPVRVVYKNYIRDWSGRYDGYIIETRGWPPIGIKTKPEYFEIGIYDRVLKEVDDAK